MGLRAVLGRWGKISPPPGFDPRTVQPLGSRYTDWATGPMNRKRKAIILKAVTGYTTSLPDSAVWYQTRGGGGEVQSHYINSAVFHGLYNSVWPNWNVLCLNSKIVTSYVTMLFQLYRPNRIVWNGRLDMDCWNIRIWKVAAVRVLMLGSTMKTQEDSEMKDRKLIWETRESGFHRMLICKHIMLCSVRNVRWLHSKPENMLSN